MINQKLKQILSIIFFMLLSDYCIAQELQNNIGVNCNRIGAISAYEAALCNSKPATNPSYSDPSTITKEADDFRNALNGGENKVEHKTCVVYYSAGLQKFWINEKYIEYNNIDSLKSEQRWICGKSIVPPTDLATDWQTISQSVFNEYISKSRK